MSTRKYARKMRRKGILKSAGVITHLQLTLTPLPHHERVVGANPVASRVTLRVIR